MQRGIAIGSMSALGHSRPMRSKPREHVCPLLPESGQLADGLGMSAWCHERTHASQQNLEIFRVLFNLLHNALTVALAASRLWRIDISVERAGRIVVLRI